MSESALEKRVDCRMVHYVKRLEGFNSIIFFIFGKNRSMRHTIHFILLLSALSICSCDKKEETAPPNFVFILVDDLGWTDLACYGSTFYETPNLDRLAGESLRFTNAYSAASICSPTRAAIMTGRHPVRVDITDWIKGLDPKNKPLLGPQDRDELPLEEKTLAEYMQEAGYKTFFAGKWHLGSEGFYPEDQGFQINKGGHEKGTPPGGYYVPYNNPKLSDGPEGEYLTDRLTDESIRFLEANKDDPFFLFLSFYTVHTPIQANKKHVAKFEEKARSLQIDSSSLKVTEGEAETLTRQIHPDYASMVYAMDQNVGRLLNTLNELELDQNTVVVFTSDNGGLTTEPPNKNRNRPPTSVRPLRAGKGWLYEGGIRIPLMIKGPGISEKGTSDAPVVSQDLFPTLLSLAGLSPEPDIPLDGKNLSLLLSGQTPSVRDTLYWHYPHYHGSRWKPGAAVRAGDWKLLEFYENEKVELYNLKEDIGETTDLSQQEPEQTAALLKVLHDWQERMEAKWPVKNSR
jgi:arylsulfatase A-like enzyme